MIGRMRNTLSLVLVLAALVGCSGYTLQGRVVEGMSPAMLFVPADDEQLGEPGVPNVRIAVYRDPDRLSRKEVANGYSRVDGRFEIPIGEFGAGWMDEQWMVVAWRENYETVEGRLDLLRSKGELLVVLRPGRSIAPAPASDIDQIYERYK